VKAIAVLLLVVFVGAVGVSSGGPLCGTLVKHPELDGKLEISADQREQLEKLYEDTEKEIIEAGAELEIKRLEMERLMRSDDPDMREVRKLVGEMGDARSAMMLAGIEREIRTKRILGREQIKRARHAMMRMGSGRRAAAGRGGVGLHRPGMRSGRAGRPGMGRMRESDRMMQGERGSGRHGAGCRGRMMQRSGGAGEHPGGCKGHTMQGGEGKGRHEKGCRGRMMQRSGGAGEQEPDAPEGQ